MIEAELPDGRVLEFPDGTKPEVMQAAVKKMLTGPSAMGKLAQAATSGALPGGRGLGMGGPLGAATGAIAEGTKQAQAAYDKLAYGAGGKVTDITGSPEAGFAANLAVQAVPVVAGAAGAKVTSPAFVSAAKGLMQRAVKPNYESLANGNAAKAIQSMLDEGINASESGMAKVQTQLNKLREQTKAVIANSSGEVDKNKVANELLGVLDRVQRQGIYKKDVKAVESAFDEFMSHPLIKGDKIPVQLAQDMKKAGNKKLSGDYGELSSADIESQKAIVRGLKEGIETAAPEVAPLNARQAELLNILKVAQRRSLMSGNQTAAGHALTAQNPIAGTAMALEKEAPIQSALARALYQNSGTIPTTVGGLAGGVEGMSSGRPTDPLDDIIARLRSGR